VYVVCHGVYDAPVGSCNITPKISVNTTIFTKLNSLDPNLNTDLKLYSIIMIIKFFLSK